MINTLFVNTNDSHLFRYFRIGREWKDCFIVELKSNDNHHQKLYWGNVEYVEEERKEISSLLTILVLPDAKDEWKQISETVINGSPTIKEILQKSLIMIDKNIHYS